MEKAKSGCLNAELANCIAKLEEAQIVTDETETARATRTAMAAAKDRELREVVLFSSIRTFYKNKIYAERPLPLLKKFSRRH